MSTYYVDSVSGLDTYSGTSADLAWKTIGKVNIAVLTPGDSVLFKRGCVWNDTNLTIPASGTSGNPITFDSYGVGAPPTFDYGYVVQRTDWTLDSGNIWKATVPAFASPHYCAFGGIYGTRQAAGKSSCVLPRQWNFTSPTLYVYATQNPNDQYGPVTLMGCPWNAQAIYISGKTYINIQHLRVLNFDNFGLYIDGASNNINIANCYFEGRINVGTMPIAFYVNSTGAANIAFYNCDAHLNYYGWSVTATVGSPVTLKNCRSYANRGAALKDATGNVVTYSYCHFYGSNLSGTTSDDTQGGINGGSNIAPYTMPSVVSFKRYPTKFNYSIDDIGFTPGSEDFVASMADEFEKRGQKISFAVVAGGGYSGLVPNIAKIQALIARGHDVVSHSWSHQYANALNSFRIQYKGAGTACTVTVAGNILQTLVTGGPGGENLNFDLTNTAYDQCAKLMAAVNATLVYAADIDPVDSAAVTVRDTTHTKTLADLTAQACKAAPYKLVYDWTRLYPDEMSSSKSWISANLVGAGNCKGYVYPGGFVGPDNSNAANVLISEGYAAAAGYLGARGMFSLPVGNKAIPDLGVCAQNLKASPGAAVHALGADLATLRNIGAQLTWKCSVWGINALVFGHYASGELTIAEACALLDGALTAGAIPSTLTAIFTEIAGWPVVDATNTYVNRATSDAVDMTPNPGDVVINTGANLGALYKFDLFGRNQDSLGNGWDIGSMAVGSVRLSTAWTQGVPLTAQGGTGAQSIKLIPACRVFMKSPDSITSTPVNTYAAYSFKTNGAVPPGWNDLGIMAGIGKLGYIKNTAKVSTGMDKVVRKTYVSDKSFSIEVTLSQFDDYVLQQLGLSPNVTTTGSAVNFQFGQEEVVERALLLVFVNKLDGKELHWYHPAAQINATIEDDADSKVVKIVADLIAFTPSGSSQDALVSTTVFA